MLFLSRTIHFNAAHRLYRRDRPEEWNQRVYGDASRSGGYGHNYSLEVEVTGRPDADSSMIVNLTDLDRVLKEEVDGPLDHRHLNLEVAEFAETVPTAEHLAHWIWRRVEARLASDGWPCRLATLTLTATPSFSAELVAPDLEGAGE